MPTHGSPDELSSIFPATLSFLSYNVEVKGGAESRGLREVLRVLLLPQNPTNTREHPSSHKPNGSGTGSPAPS